jgi:hypothetical protein
VLGTVRKFPVFFPVNGKSSRDGFAEDCIHRHLFCEASEWRLAAAETRKIPHKIIFSFAKPDLQRG